MDFVKGGYWLASTASRLPLDNIDARFYTHLFVGYAYVDSTSYQLTLNPSEATFINQFSSTVRFSNSQIKTLLSITAENEIFARIAKDQTNLDVFIKSSIDLARAAQFDGLDLQWLYPSSHEEMKAFETLLISWHKAIIEDAINLSLPELLLVATVSNLPYLKDYIQYPIQAIKENLNWVNVISYDFYTPISCYDSTGPSSAFNNPKDNNLSAEFGISSWIEANLPSEKIVFGIPFHGWAWELANSSRNYVFSKADGAAKGKNILGNGEIYYSSVKKFIEKNQARFVNNDNVFMIAYTYYDTTWIAYESEYTMVDKLSMANSKNVLGYFASNIAADDDVNTLAKVAFGCW